MSSGLFMCYREIIPSTSVAAASFFVIKNPITNNPEECLIIATTSNISVYKIVQHENRVFSKLVYTTSIFGKVRDIQVIHSQIFGYTSEDQIIMSFDDGKFVIVEYDCIKGEFIVDNMYNAEEGAIGRGAEIHVEPQERLSFPGIGRIPIMSVDPVGSVVCSVLYGFKLFLIPLNSTVYNVMQTKPPKPFIFELKSIGLLGPILDILFISGYSRPVLAVLHEPRPLPIGHTSKIRNSCCLSVLAVDVALSKLVVLWQQDNLPHDCYRLSPLLHHSIPGGVIVTSTNALLIACQDAIVGLAMNGFAGIIPTDNIRLQPSTLPIGVELDASKIVEAGNNCIVISLKDGQLLQIKFVIPMESSWTGLRFESEIIATSIRARCFCVSESMGLWFLGSAVSDSLIMSVTYAENNTNGLSASNNFASGIGGGTGGGGTGTPATKRLRKVTRTSTPNPEAQLQLQIQQHQQQQQQLLIKFSEEIDQEEISLYGAPLRTMTTKGTYSITSHLHITVIETIPVLGPVIDGLFGTADESLGVNDNITWTKSDRLPPPWTPPAAAFIADKDAKDWLQLNVGLGDAASLCRISLGLRLAKLSSLDLSGITFFTSLVLSSSTLLFLTQNNNTKILEMKEISDELHMVEVHASDRGFVENTTTITVAFILNNILLQVFPSGLRMIRVDFEVDSYSALQDILVEEDIDLGGLGGESGENIISANICNGWVVVMTSLKSVYLLEVQVEGEDTDLLLRYKIGHQLELNDISSILTDIKATVDTASFFFGHLNVSDNISHSVTSPKLRATSSTSNHHHQDIIPKEGSGNFSKKIAAEELYLYQNTDTIIHTNMTIDATTTKTTTNSNIQFVSIIPENKRKRESDDNNSNNLEEADNNSSYDNNNNSNNNTNMTISEEEAAASNDSSIITSLEEKVKEKQVQEKQSVDIFNIHTESRSDMDITLSNNNDYDHDNSTTTTATTNDNNSNDRDNEKQLYLLLSTSNGSIFCIRLTDLRLMFQISNILFFPSVLPIDTTSSDRRNSSSSGKNDTITNEASDENRTNERQILNMKLYRIPSGDLPEAEAPVVLVIISENEDIFLYSGIECNGFLSSFRKIEHNAVTRRKKPSQLLLKQSWIDSGCNIQLQQFMLTGMIEVSDIDGRSGILLSGTQPQFIFADKGLPTMMSLGFPELPYITETGAYCIGTLKCGDVRGVLSLWNDVSEAYPGIRLSTLGVYKEVPNLKTFPTAGVSLRQSMIGCTVHKCVEILPKTEDRTQLALLSRRTFIMLCSEDNMIRLPKQMLTEKDKEVDRATYERFFPEMEGYYTLDDNLGSAPLVSQRLYKLILVQNAIVVDTYQLSEGEVILDVDAIYFTSEIEVESSDSPDTKEDATGSNDIPPPIDSNEKTKSIKKSICIAASTSRCDKHGEDSQGEGRLLLFSLDFALYQDDQDDHITTTTITEPSTAESKDNNDTSTASQSTDPTNSTTTTSSSSTTTPATTPATTTTPTTTTSTAQSQFLKAIQPKLNLLWTGPGPSMVVKQFGEYLLSTVGQTVFIYRLDPALMELEQIAQFYAQFYIVKVSIIKNYIMLADACKSVQFLIWRASDNSLTLLSKDFYNCYCMCADYLLDNSTLGMVLGDDEGNIRLLQYNPRVLESRKGFQLLCLAEMHLGSIPTMLLPHRVLVDPIAAPLPPTTPLSSQLMNNMNRLLQYRKLQRERSMNGMTVTTRPYGGKLDKNASKKSSLVIGTADGSLGLLVAVEEKTYRRLALLQQIMSTSIKTSFGLNPREFRIVKTEKFRLEKKRGVLDGNLLWKFINLEPNLQDELTAAMGTTVDKVLENLLEIDILNSFF